MVSFVIRRSLEALPVLFFVSVAVFSMVHLLPGDPVRSLIPVGDQTVDPAEFEEAVQRVRKEHGLDDPLPQQYVRWLTRALSGDLGTSIATKQHVATMIRERLPVTVSLGAMSALISLSIAIPAGVIASLRRNSWVDIVATVFSLCFVAMPGFWLGMLLILVFVVWLDVLPGPGSYVELWVDPWRSLQLSIMPAIALAGFSMAALMRLTRSSMLEVLAQDYIRTARAKGLGKKSVVLRHALRNAALPLVTFLGLQTIFVFSGSVVIERLFAIPGVGSMAVDAIFSRDFPVIQGMVFVTAFVVVVVNVLVDVVYSVVDPRIRVGL
ncbi:MAG: ABC transporter permease [Dehalococcoidia bacterium]|nr:ABC transporter permease [Dehalococcoidia bacterium]